MNGIHSMRIWGLLILMGLVLSACSLAEDITPPPGYQNATPLAQGSSTVGAASTAPPAIAPTGLSTETRLLQTGPVTPGAEITLTGKVTNGTSGSLPSTPITANLYLYDTSTTGIDKTMTAQVAPSGTFEFDHVPANSKISYYVMVDYSGVTYVSDEVTYDGIFTNKTFLCPFTTQPDDLSQLSISQAHIQFDFSTSGQMQARTLYVVSDLGTKAVKVQSDGTKIPFIQIPAGATNTHYELAQGGTPLARATGGFALLPGADKQYGLIASFSLPYSQSVGITQPFSLPVSSETVMVPVGVRVRSSQLSDIGVQNIQGTNYQIYQGGELASGGTLSFTVTGKPGKSRFTISQQMTILFTLLGIGLLLIGAGIFLLRRNQSRQIQGSVISTDSTGGSAPAEDREVILDAIITLDDQYKVGSIDKAAYDKRRDALKKRLKELF